MELQKQKERDLASESLLVDFFEAQELAEDGLLAEAEKRYKRILQVANRPASNRRHLCSGAPDTGSSHFRVPASDVHGEEILQHAPAAASTLPPLCVLLSTVMNALGEFEVDRAILKGFPFAGEATKARYLIKQAIDCWPGNTQALLNLALLERDEGSLNRAVELFQRVAELPFSIEAGDSWAESWSDEPRRHNVPLACMHSALKLFQLGEHTRALRFLRRFGFRYCLSAAVWEAARTKPCVTDPSAFEPSLSVESNDRPRLWAHAIPPLTYAALQRALAPNADYWQQTGYASASAQKRYFTFSVSDLPGLRDGVRTPSNLMEALVLRLLPVTGRDDLVEAEWWAHSRLAFRSEGHELHYDLEERMLETHGEIVHPAVSSVVYLSASGDPTLVLDQHIGGALASRGWLVHPQEAAFMTFPGDKLHGVLPTLPAPTPERSCKAAPATQRLTLLIAWYSRATATATQRRHLGPQAPLPRFTRQQTWPADFQLTRETAGELQCPTNPKSLPIQAVSEPWESIDYPINTTAGSSGCTSPAPGSLWEVPQALKQHFFLHEPDEVSTRLWAEHGIDGAYAKVKPAKRPKRD